MPNDKFLDKSSGTVSSTGQTNSFVSKTLRNNFLPSYINTPDENVSVERSVTAVGPLTSVVQVPQTTSSASIVDRFSAPNLSSVDAASILNRSSSSTFLQGGNFADVQSGSTIFAQSQQATGSSLLNTSGIPNNVLDDYDNVTYNFSLKIVPDLVLDIDTIDSSINSYTIAESGVSGSYYISDVEIESIVGPNERTRNQQAYLYNITIVEPNGISLLDRLIQAATELGIKNITNAPMLLELSFKGYTQSGQPTEVRIARQSWRIQLTDIETSLDAGGSSYKLSCIALQDYAFHRMANASIIKQEMSFPISTVGQLFQDLGFLLTIQESKAAIQGHTTRNEYEFIVNPEMTSWQIGDPLDTKNSPSIHIDKNRRSIAIDKGTNLTDLVNSIISSTKEGNIALNPASDPNLMSNQSKGRKISRIPSITAETKILGYNAENNEYLRKYIYYINLYDVPRVLIEKPTDEDDKEKIDYLLQTSLKRKYEYIFTGQNTSVLNLNLDLNLLWRHATAYNPVAISRPNNINSNFINNVNPTVTVDSLRPNIESKSNQFSSTMTKADAQDVLAIFDPEGTTVVPVNNTTQPNILGTNSRIELDESNRIIDAEQKIIPVENAGGVTTINTTSDTGRLATGLASGRNLSNVPGVKLIENLPRSSDNTINTLFIKQVDPALNTKPVQQNIEESISPERTVFGIVTNQLYSKTYANLLSIELEIRGDPYWLGESEIQQVKRLRSFNVSAIQGESFANYLRGESCFLLSMKTPRNYNESTGFVELEKSDLFLGVYNVTTVVHSFSDGKFTQKISAIRNLDLNAKFLERLTKG